MEYYKSLTADNKGPYTNFDFSDYLPKKGKPGKWLPVVKKLSLCQSGWHGCTTSQLIEWLNANIYEIEFRGKKKTGTQKICGEQIRFVRKVLGEYDLQVFACDCADHVLHLYEDKYPNDKRPREAIEARRKFAKGEITAAAGDAARAAEKKWQVALLKKYICWAKSNPRSAR